MSYIYKITNDINNKIYIGKTDFNIQKRWSEHCKDARQDRQEQRPLYNAIKKYGIEHFHIEEIEECSIELASDREKYWIEYYGSFKYGYNATIGGDGRSYVDVEIICSLWNEGYNITKIHNITGYDTSTISNHLTNYGISSPEKYKRGYAALNKTVAQIDKDTDEIIRVFSSTEEAKRQLKLKNCGHISEVCHGRRKTAYGYKWKYL